MSPKPKPSPPGPCVSCPFCAIASTYAPMPPTWFLASSPELPTKESETKREVVHPDKSSCALINTTTTTLPMAETRTRAHLILSTKHVLAFLDIMPLTRGHVLVTTRQHFEKLGEVGVGVGKEVGKWLPIVSRVVTRTLFGNDDADCHWNVVQNNGDRAAQQVPHVHFHIIPRPPLDAVPSAGKMRFIMFGRGQRDELDDEEGEQLAKALREEMAREVRRIRQEEGIDLDADSDNASSGSHPERISGKL